MKIRRYHTVEDNFVFCFSMSVGQNGRCYKSVNAFSIREMSRYTNKFRFLRHLLKKQKQEMICNIKADKQ